ncbi:DUF3397 family protein [Amphibacillus sediminis]|uniref:DUF3397 family protein n=1 Tax=Amphibacillus sediminis TaxID=360185 RepID=UPI00082F9AF0|nr:DUF3397 family protein [Amphibacillus sediminis]
MIQILTYLLAVSVTFPIIVTLIIYGVRKMITGNNKRAIHESMQFSAIFYLILFFIMFEQTFHFSIIGPVTLVLLIVFLILIIFQWKLVGDILIRRVCQLYWRALFLILFFINLIVGTIAIVLKLNS